MLNVTLWHQIPIRSGDTAPLSGLLIGHRSTPCVFAIADIDPIPSTKTQYLASKGAVAYADHSVVSPVIHTSLLVTWTVSRRNGKRTIKALGPSEHSTELHGSYSHLPLDEDTLKASILGCSKPTAVHGSDRMTVQGFSLVCRIYDESRCYAEDRYIVDN